MSGSNEARQRVTRACDSCHAKGTKCVPLPDETSSGPSSLAPQCQRCTRTGAVCTWLRPIKRRGPPRKLRDSTPSATGADVHSPATAALLDAASLAGQPTPPGWYQPPSASLDRSTSITPQSVTPTMVQAPSQAPRAPGLADFDREAIEGLVECYHEIVYPIFNFFHFPTFSYQVRLHLDTLVPAFRCTVLAMSGLVAHRMKAGATCSSHRRLGRAWHDRVINGDMADGMFRAAELGVAEGVKGAVWEEGMPVEWLRATALLAIGALQRGEITAMQGHLGRFITLSSVIGLHDERTWPANLNVVEKEERRRLFWSIYTLDIFAAIVWGGFVRFREAASLVAYPTEADDINIDATSIRQPPAGAVSWMRGWNATTELYRLLEHALDASRSSRLPEDSRSTLVSSLYSANPRATAVLELVKVLEAKMNEDGFGKCAPMTGDATRDIHSFQSANLTVTRQTVLMVVLGKDNYAVERRCQVAVDLLSALRKIPVEYFQAISTPILHHLAGIGMFLGEIVKAPFSRKSFTRVRAVLLELADFLADLESKMHLGEGASGRLKSSLDRIDEFMRTAGQQRLSRHHSRQPSRRTSVEPGSPPVPEPSSWIQALSPSDLQVDRDLPSNLGQDGLSATLMATDIFSPPGHWEYSLPADWSFEWPFDMSAGSVLWTAPSQQPM